MISHVSHPLDQYEIFNINVKYFFWTSAKTFCSAVVRSDIFSTLCLPHKKYFTGEILLPQNSPFWIASHLQLQFTQVPRMGLRSSSCSLRHYCCTCSFPFCGPGRGGNSRVHELPDSLPSYNLSCRGQAKNKRKKVLFHQEFLMERQSQQCAVTSNL